MSGNLISDSINEDKIVNLSNPTEEQLALIHSAQDEGILNLIISPIKNINKNK